MQVSGGRHIEHYIGPGHGQAAGLLNEVGQRVAFVEQAQLAAGLGRGGRIQVNAAGEEVAVVVGHQRAHVAGREAALFALHQEGSHKLRVVEPVALVAAEHRSLLRNDDGRVREKEFAQRRFVGKAHHAVPGGVHEHGAGAIQNVAGGNLGAAALQEVLQPGRAANARHPPVNAENGADAHVHVNIRGAVEWVHRHHVLAVLIASLNDFFVLLRKNSAALPAIGQRPNEADVGFHIEPLLGLALHVVVAHGPGDARKAGPVHVAVHDFTGQRDVAQQLAQLTGGERKFRLLAHDVALQGGADGRGQGVFGGLGHGWTSGWAVCSIERSC